MLGSMNNTEIAIVDYGVGNLLSVTKALEYCGANVKIISKPEDLLSFSKVVLPGVGAFSYAMDKLSNQGLDIAIKKIANRGDILLGICLGMQLLLDESEEFGTTNGLGLIPGKVIRIPLKVNNVEHKIPHIGWSEIHKSHSNLDWKDSVLGSTSKNDAFYFVHSFMAQPVNKLHQLADCSYGGINIPTVLKNKNILGCQFHPEKSGNSGLNFLSNFLKI